MKLFYTPGACSLAPHIGLREAGIEFALDKVDLATRKTESGEDSIAVNPKGYVPALALDDGDVLTECPAIMQHVADLAPASGLAPQAGTRERVHLQEWLNFVAGELHKTLGPLFRSDLPDGYREAVDSALRPRLDYLDGQLAGRKHLLGERFTVADAYAFTILNWSGPLAIHLASWGSVRAYQERIASRPAVQEAMRAEGLLKRAAA